MNLKLPWANDPHGTDYAVALMAVSTISILVYFKAKRWFSEQMRCPTLQSADAGHAIVQHSYLLLLAGDVVVPVHKRAVRILSPRPHVQFEKVGQVKAIRRGHKLKVLPIERWRRVVVFFSHVAASTMYSTPTSLRRFPTGS